MSAIQVAFFYLFIYFFYVLPTAPHQQTTAQPDFFGEALIGIDENWLVKEVY